MSLRNHSWRDVVRALRKLGFFVKRQSGSHMILEHCFYAGIWLGSVHLRFGDAVRKEKTAQKPLQIRDVT